MWADHRPLTQERYWLTDLTVCAVPGLGLKHTATPASDTYLKLTELSPAAVMLLHFYLLPVATS